jgi:hypothetical protein
MPLLKGKFDPKRFNSTTLAIQMYQVQARESEQQNYPEIILPPWVDLDESLKMQYVDQAQQIIERLVAAEVIS